jgi:protein-tyrosine-phosphatase
MKISVVCHGNIARSQVLHHYITKYASEAGRAVEVFSCGTAPWDAYPNAEALLAQVQRELEKRGVMGAVVRNVLDDSARRRLENSDAVLAADQDIKDEVLELLKHDQDRKKVSLFYEYIGEGTTDFVDTYDPDANTQDPARFARCFDELERIAEKVVHRLA